MEMLDMPITAHAQQSLTDIEFCVWVGQAAPGDQLEYHSGFLSVDTTPMVSRLQEADRRRLAALASAAHRAFEAGLVHLVQRRLGPNRFAYLAVMRTRPKNWKMNSSSIAELKGIA